MVTFCCGAVVVIVIVILLILALRREKVVQYVYPGWYGQQGPPQRYPPPQQYPPGQAQTLHCPTCGAPAIWVVAHGRYECPGCGRYI
jgi:hypothetical protein